MRKYWALIRVNFRVLLSNFAGAGAGSKKRKAASGLGAIILMVFLSLYISVVYSMLLGQMLQQSGLIKMLPVMMAAASAMMSLLFTAFAAGGMVFGSKDMDLMLALPLSAFSVMLTKIMALYLENLVFCVFMMLPAGVAYLAYGGLGGAAFMLRMLICTVFLPLLPTIFSLLIGFVLTWINGHVKHKTLVVTIANFVFFGFVMYFAMGMNTLIDKLAANSLMLDGIFSTWLLPIGLMRDAMYGNYLAMLCFAAILLLPFLAIVYVLSKGYKKLLTALSSHITRSDYKLGSLKAKGRLKALFAKEMGRFFGTPIYIFNTGFGALMAVGASVAAIIFKDEMLEILRLSNTPVLPMLMLCMALVLSTICPACVAISLEGKTMWILKEAPISPRSIFLAKAGVNAVLIWGTGLICVPMLLYAFELNIAQAAVLLVLVFSVGVFVSLCGIGINMLFPKMDGINDTVTVKQSLSALLGIFGPMAAMGLGVLAYNLGLGAMLGDIPFILCACAILLILSGAIYKCLVIKGSQKLLRL